MIRLLNKDYTYPIKWSESDTKMSPWAVAPKILRCIKYWVSTQTIIEFKPITFWSQNLLYAVFRISLHQYTLYVITYISGAVVSMYWCSLRLGDFLQACFYIQFPFKQHNQNLVQNQHFKLRNLCISLAAWSPPSFFRQIQQTLYFHTHTHTHTFPSNVFIHYFSPPWFPAQALVISHNVVKNSSLQTLL